MKASLDYRDVYEEDSAEFVLCSACRFWQHGKCIKKESIINSAHPSEGDFLGGLYGICREFKGPSVPMSPSKFADLMKRYISLSCPNPYEPDSSSDDILRFRLEFLMCEVLKELGYDDGVKAFMNVGFDVPF